MSGSAPSGIVYPFPGQTHRFPAVIFIGTILQQTAPGARMGQALLACASFLVIRALFRQHRGTPRPRQIAP